MAFSFSTTKSPARIPDMLKAAAYFLGFMALFVALFLLYTVFGDSVPIPIANLISYTGGVFWFVFCGSSWLGGGYSLRHKAVRQTIPRLLVIHAGFLVLMFAVQSLALSYKPRLPAEWLREHGKDPSWFVSGLMVIFLLIGTVQITLSRRILSRSLESEIPRDATTV